MTHTPASRSLAPASSTASPGTTRLDTTRHDGWTTARQVTFLQTLAATHSVARAAQEAGMSRQSAYQLRARLKGEPFDLAWTAAFRSRFDVLAEAAMDRAVNGVEVPHFYKGELVYTSRRYDERLTIALLLMREKFRPPHRLGSHLATAYDPDDFAKLVNRVERGPPTWEEQARQEREALYGPSHYGQRLCAICASEHECDCAADDYEAGDAGEATGDCVG